jgi:hypothetical protein
VSLRLVTAAVLAARVLGAAPSPAPAGPSEASRREFCSLLAGCGLPAPEGACPAALSRGVKGVRYDEARCREPRALFARGVRPEGDLGFRVYRFLGRRYRVVYPVEGQLAISVPRMSFLLQDLPFAARLLAHFQKVDYAAEYLDPDRRRFRGRRGTALTGEAELLAGGPAERSLAYYGRGTSDLGPWKMRGVGLVLIDYAPTADGRALAYRMHVVATPTNAFYNFIMNRGRFRSVLQGKVREVMDDVAEASRKLQADPAGLPAASWPPADAEKLRALRQLP